MPIRFSYAFYIWTIVSCVALHTSVLAAQENPAGNSDESKKIEQCRQQLDACVRAAEAPESVDSCSEQDARCIAEAMKVSVPAGTSVATLTQCTANAADCSVLAYTPVQLDTCARTLAGCVNGVAGTQLTCGERWTQCVNEQPLLLAICSLELLGCQDP